MWDRKGSKEKRRCRGRNGVIGTTVFSRLYRSNVEGLSNKTKEFFSLGFGFRTTARADRGNLIE